MEKLDDFNVIVLGIIFDPKKKKILIGRRDKDPHVPKLKWTPPGGRVAHGEDIEISLKTKIKKQTGLHVANLGHIFSTIPKEKKNFMLVIHLCEVVSEKKRQAAT